MSGYQLFVNKDRTMMVRYWPAAVSGIGEDTVEVATRERPDEAWGPPVVLKEEEVR